MKIDKIATSLVQKIINSSNILELAQSYDKYMDELVTSKTLNQHEHKTLLIAAYEAGLKIGVKIDPKGNMVFCPCKINQNFFPVKGQFLELLENYYNLELFRHNVLA